jgi:hypothetical protein
MGLSILVMQTWVLASTVEALQTVAQNVQEESISIGQPDPRFAEWPIVGDSVHKIRAGAATNPEVTLNQFQPQLLAFGQWAFAFAGSAAMGILQFVFPSLSRVY